MPRLHILSFEGVRKPATIIQRPSGTYDVEFTPESDGPHQIDVTYGGQPVASRSVSILLFCLYHINQRFQRYSVVLLIKLSKTTFTRLTVAPSLSL